MSAGMEDFAWPIRVYYEDTDAAGIVYHANYLRFMERARTEWLRALGFEQDAMAAQFGVMFVITRSQLRFLRVARFNQELVVVSHIQRLRGASIEFSQAIAARTGETVCSAHNTVGCVDCATLAPRRIPPPMFEVFKRAH
jgi:acyl-CoA thioester hydrolase